MADEDIGARDMHGGLTRPLWLGWRLGPGVSRQRCDKPLWLYLTAFPGVLMTWGPRPTPKEASPPLSSSVPLFPKGSHVSS